jgi:hypothetical protein
MTGVPTGLDWAAAMAVVAGEPDLDRGLFGVCLAAAETGMLDGHALTREGGDGA